MGRVFKFGDNIDTDLIIPARYLDRTDPKELGAHCMEGVDPEFPKKVKEGDIIVAGYNFGCGSSREHAPLAIKGCGVACVIAKSFARIFFRNAINTGLPILESRDAHEIDEGDEVEVDLEKGEIRDITKEKIFRASPFPDFMLEIMKAGGLTEYTKRRLK